MTTFTTINLNAAKTLRFVSYAEPPKPHWLLSWFMSSRFSFIRNEAKSWYRDQVYTFRHKERLAIEDARSVEKQVRNAVLLDRSLESIKHQLNILNRNNQRLQEQIRTYPEVQKILKNVYNELLDSIKAKRITYISSQDLPKILGFYNYVLSNPKTPLYIKKCNLHGAEKINHTVYLRR